MNTLKITAEEMKARISRFSDRRLNPAYIADPAIPAEAYRAVLPALYLMTGRAPNYSPGDAAPSLLGTGGASMAVAECSPGEGAPLHVHLRSTETFICLKGRFEVRWNDAGEDRIVLDPFDTITIPPGLYRGFRNVLDETSLLLVVSTGETEDDGLIVSPDESKQITERFGSDVVEKLAARTGFQFAGAAAK